MTMFRKLTLSAVAAVSLLGTQAAAEGDVHISDVDFSFDGMFGAFDQMQLQRGLQIYTEICSACHGLEHVAIRTLGDEGGPALPEDQVFAYAEYYEVFDQALFDGEGDFRPATPADKFPAVTSVGAPDLSLMAKSRAGFHGPAGTGLNQLWYGMGGAEYITAILSGYEEEPECAADANMEGYYNTAFAVGGFPESCVDEEGHNMVLGSWIAMAPPLYDGAIEFNDGHANDIQAMSEDTAAFLMWTAEPKMMARKQAGLTGVIFLAILSVLLYLTNKRLWAPHKKKD
ncbi:ubiquinol-cytochrome c reductase cytochrome c1 subunit [Loktanella ponticola]|uniref:Cytochrome c1 n=1 Tax=Yoonia ponticola TaxID=1524255 RepID=A0A7W9BHC4_9RHOB|nr:cytochrome c1 [Yoonia ponticola]MBB5720552.1 ubiquinol-cytochrome c reductase cytochrome c1 subunit [Yoonia ponticola]